MNNVCLVGRLVRDPELRFISGSGQAVANFTLAVDKQLSKDKKAQFESQGKPTADFIRIIVWGKMAENVATYTKKGLLVSVEGSIQTGSYEKNGVKHFTTDINARSVNFLEYGGKNETSMPASEIADEDDMPF